MSDRTLTAKQRAFVRAYISLGGTNATAAAVTAGYAPSKSKKRGDRSAGASVTAHRLLQKPTILKAIREETERALRAGVALGAHTLEQLCREANSESVRLQAAQALLDRGGMQLATLSQHHVVVEDRRTEGELLARVKELQRELGLNSIDITPPAGTSPTIKRAALAHVSTDLSPSGDLPGASLGSARPSQAIEIVDPIVIDAWSEDEA